MSKSSFEEQIMQGVYVLGSQAFAAMGAVSLILSDVNSLSDTWLFTNRVWKCAERPKDGQPDQMLP
jgi:hypothetical protein